MALSGLGRGEVAEDLVLAQSAPVVERLDESEDGEALARAHAARAKMAAALDEDQEPEPDEPLERQPVWKRPRKPKSKAAKEAELGKQRRRLRDAGRRRLAAGQSRRPRSRQNRIGNAAARRALAPCPGCGTPTPGCGPDNPASGRVLIKAGFTRVGTFDRHTDDGTIAYELYALETAAT